MRQLAIAATVAAALAGCSSAGSAPWIGPTDGALQPDPGGRVVSYQLTAQPAEIELKPGLRIAAWTFNGTVPGPTITAHTGDLVRVALHNRLTAGTTIHWHGLTVPNGEDGVAGVTQDPVPPGRDATYSFVPEVAGTYWYHSHQDAAYQVDRGLYGAIVILPRGGPAPATTDSTVIYDEWPLGLERSPQSSHGDFAMVTEATYSVNGKSGASIVPIRFQSGQQVRLRLINVGVFSHFVVIDGPAAVRIAALDGHELEGGPPVTGAIPIGPGERVDVVFNGPDRAVWLHLADALPPAADAILPLLPAGMARPPIPALSTPNQSVDLLEYPARAVDALWPVGGHPDRTYVVSLTTKPDPKSMSPDGLEYRIDGAAFPNNGTLEVTYRDLVEIDYVNNSGLDHSMHLHGHSFQVLSVDGKQTAGVLVKDTVVVGPHQRIAIGFKAGNPGWWMIHCHELYHARGGMMILLRYTGSSRLAQLGGPYAAMPD